MKSLVVYDSAYGNTEEIAKTISKTLADFGDSKLLQVKDAKPWDVQNTDLLVVGSPTHGGRPTPELEEFINGVGDDDLKNVKVAAFDTRFDPDVHGLGLKIVMNVIRFAAGKIAKALTRKGGKLIAEPEGFIVDDKEGPLKSGELEHAAKWARSLA
jgi:flavodoxin I